MYRSCRFVKYDWLRLALGYADLISKRSGDNATTFSKEALRDAFTKNIHVPADHHLVVRTIYFRMPRPPALIEAWWHYLREYSTQVWTSEQ
jgi:hypothetical protein